QVDDGLAELAGLHRQRVLELGAALVRLREIFLEAAVLRLERGVLHLGGFDRLRVLAHRDASGDAEGDKDQSGNRQQSLVHQWSPRSESLANVPGGLQLRRPKYDKSPWADEASSRVCGRAV